MQSSSEEKAAVARSIFVGRRPELSALRSALSEACAGRGSTWLLVGEPGIGKTRIATELAGDESAAGVQVYWGRCRESEGAPVFWPWIEIARSYLRDCDDAEARRVLGGGAAELAQIVPEVLERCPDLEPPPPLEGPAARFRMFDSMAAFLRNAAEETPLLIVIDDLHWADGSSVAMLEHVLPAIEDTAVLLVGTYRPVEVERSRELSTAIGEISRRARSLFLSGLSRGEVEAYLRELLGTRRADEMSAVVFEKSEGNALFVGEIARLLARTPKSARTTTAESLPVTDGIRHAISKRIEALSGETLAVLRCASAIGREFDSRMLGRLGLESPPGGSPMPATADLLEEACAADIVQRVEVGERYRFSHPLVRDALYGGIPPSRRAALHRSIGLVLEEVSNDTGSDAVAELAHHFVRAASLEDTDKAVGYAKRAGDRFRRQFAYEEAASQYTAALRLLDFAHSSGEGAAQSVRRARLRGELLIALGRAQASVAYEIGGREAFSKAVEVARSLGDAELLAEAALGLADPTSLDPAGDVDTARLVEEALDALGEGDHPLRAILLTRSLVPVYYMQDRELVLRRSAEAVAIAERVCDDTALGQVLAERLLVLYGPDYLDERAGLARRLLDLAHRSKRRSLYLKGHNWSALNLLQLGEVERARGHLDRHAVLAEEQRQPFELWQAAVCRAMLALLGGELEAAERLAAEACAVGQRAHVPNAEVMLSIQVFRIRLEQGRLDEIEPMIEEFARSMAHIPAARGPLALAYGHIGRLEDCRRAFEAVASADFADYPRDSNWLTGLTDAAHVCWFLDDRERAARLYDLLRPRERLAVMGSWFAACSGTVGHYLGLLATVLGSWEDAEAHFAGAEEKYLRMGARPLLARARIDHADMLLRRGGARDRASDLLRSAMAICDEAAMPSWRDRAAELLEHGGGRLTADPPPAPAAQSDAPNSFRREGDFWTVSYEGCTVRLKALKGLDYLQILLREPGREFHIADMTGAPLGGGGLAEASVDSRARADYRRRVEDLGAELALADEHNDVLRATRVREEIDRLSEQLAAAYGPAATHARGRDPVLQNMRKAVAKSIRTAVNRIQPVHEPLWRHLNTAVRTGVFCTYCPDRTVEWIVD